MTWFPSASKDIHSRYRSGVSLVRMLSAGIQQEPPMKMFGVVDAKVKGLAVFILLLDKFCFSEPDGFSLLFHGAVDGDELQSHFIEILQSVAPGPPELRVIDLESFGGIRSR